MSLDFLAVRYFPRYPGILVLPEVLVVLKDPVNPWVLELLRHPEVQETQGYPESQLVPWVLPDPEHPERPGVLGLLQTQVFPAHRQVLLVL